MSDAAPLFYLLVFAVILSILVNLVVYLRRPEERRWEKTGLGRILAVLGGFIVLITATLPWEGWRGPAGVGYSIDPGVKANGTIGILVYVFGLFWLTFFAVPKKVNALLGLVWGGVALVLVLWAIAEFPPDPNFYIDSVAYVNILGSLALIAGSALAYVQTKKAPASGIDFRA